MDDFMEKKELDVFFEVLHMHIIEKLEKHSEHYRKLSEEKKTICENHPEYAVLYNDSELNKKAVGLNLCDKAVKNLSRLIQIEMELSSLIQEMYFFMGYREGFWIAEITKRDQ